jgi:uncharacterized tellurite resistance protein B-like protein
MKRLLPINVNKAIDPDAHRRLSAEERAAVMEIAYRAIAADGRLTDSELEAFSDALLQMYGPHVTPEEVRGIVDRLIESKSDPDSVCNLPDEERLIELTCILGSQYARDQAYKLAYAMAMADFDTNNCEFEYDQLLRRTLGLSDDAAEELADQVIDVVGVARD